MSKKHILELFRNRARVVVCISIGLFRLFLPNAHFVEAVDLLFRNQFEKKISRVSGGIAR